MGNIYTDEALFEARIHPRAIASSLSKQRATRLHRAMVDILDTAIRLKGSSISDYVDADGAEGQFSAAASSVRARRRALRYLRDADPPDRGGAARDALLSEVPAKLRIWSATCAAAFIAGYIVYANHMCAAENRRGHGRRGGAFQQLVGVLSVCGRNDLRDGPTRMGNSSCASSPSRARISAFCSLRFPNPSPGSITIRARSTPAPTARCTDASRSCTDRAHHVFERRKLGPSFRRAAHVIDDQRRVMIGHGARQLRIERQAGRIVDDLSAMLQSLFRDRRFVGVHRNRHRQLAAQPLQHGNQPAQLFGFRNALGTGPRRFRADVDDVRALLFQFDGAGEGAVGIEILAAVGERIGRDVERRP